MLLSLFRLRNGTFLEMHDSLACIKDHKGIFEKEWKQVFDTSSFGAFGCFKRCNLCTGIWPARVLEATASSMTR